MRAAKSSIGALFTRTKTRERTPHLRRRHAGVQSVALTILASRSRVAHYLDLFSSVYSLALSLAFHQWYFAFMGARDVWHMLQHRQGVRVEARAEHGELSVFAAEGLAPVLAVQLKSRSR